MFERVRIIIVHLKITLAEAKGVFVGKNLRSCCSLFLDFVDAYSADDYRAIKNFQSAETLYRLAIQLYDLFGWSV